MNNLLCSVLLIFVTAIILIDAQCNYIYTNDKYLDPEAFGSSTLEEDQSGCDQRCTTNTQCTGAFFAPEPVNICYLYEAPLISLYLDLDLTQCEDSCNQMDECITWSLGGRFQRCLLFNVDLDNLPSNVGQRDADGETIAEKQCLK
ncbi:hypothetical protein LOTGIDRAFT_229462 [Lottia gigantea]|uniref:Apple domain-containing protein n=1 Tax=Lottia gigantea TaxID=225164 RepID=V3ZXD2_LOTGI|nr:hypothetical protein LOTGIDRAFT_229462 [Lottia gigantea]ESO85621.1 hypothetical protein LOTGIDRAFT_229462 [Lottia gigantea]